MQLCVFGANSDESPIVIFDGISPAVSKSAFDTLLRMDYSLRFGFVHSNELRRVGGISWRRAEALCGPQVHWLESPAEKPLIVPVMTESADHHSETGFDKARDESQSRKGGNRSPNAALPTSEGGKTAIMGRKQVHHPNDGPLSGENNAKNGGKKRKRKPGQLRKRPDVDGQEMLKAKRDKVWNNEARNARIARIACAVRRMSKSTLVKLGCNDDVWKAVASTKRSGKPRIAIFVESAEHGRALLDLLPGWTLLTHKWRCDDAEGEEEYGEDADDSQDGDQTEQSTVQRVIVTETYAANNHLVVDVVIAASGCGDDLIWKNTAGRSVPMTNGINTQTIIDAGYIATGV